MGCKVSLQSPVVFTRTVSLHDAPSTPGGSLEPAQKKLLQRSWKTLSSDRTARGCRVFERIFQQNPAVKDLFDFRDLTGEDLIKEHTFRSHAARFMNSLGAIMENIDNYEKDLSPLLVTLGRNHVRIPSFNPNYFSAFEEAILHVWTEDLGEKFTPECKKAWECVLRFIHLTLKSGYFQAMNENIREDQKTVCQG